MPHIFITIAVDFWVIEKNMWDSVFLVVILIFRTQNEPRFQRINKNIADTLPKKKKPKTQATNEPKKNKHQKKTSIKTNYTKPTNQITNKK